MQYKKHISWIFLPCKIPYREMNPPHQRWPAKPTNKMSKQNKIISSLRAYKFRLNWPSTVRVCIRKFSNKFKQGSYLSDTRVSMRKIASFPHFLAEKLHSISANHVRLFAVQYWPSTKVEKDYFVRIHDIRDRGTLKRMKSKSFIMWP